MEDKTGCGGLWAWGAGFRSAGNLWSTVHVLTGSSDTCAPSETLCQVLMTVTCCGVPPSGVKSQLRPTSYMVNSGHLLKLFVTVVCDLQINTVPRSRCDDSAWPPRGHRRCGRCFGAIELTVHICESLLGPYKTTLRDSNY